MPLIHASAVAAKGRAALIVGASGSGKSSLALQLLAFGAALICDDQVDLTVQNGALIAGPAPNIAGMIEARGVGLLKAPVAGPTPVACVIDLNALETERLPERERTYHGVSLPLFHKCEGPAWPAAIWLYLSHGPAML
ncbi:MAG: HPr kinase/phosphatase C-terminal domain-containing protein [Pseudomonadota bacterium]